MSMNDSHTCRVSLRLFVSIVLRNTVLLKNLICSSTPGGRGAGGGGGGGVKRNGRSACNGSREGGSARYQRDDDPDTTAAPQNVALAGSSTPLSCAYPHPNIPPPPPEPPTALRAREELPAGAFLPRAHLDLHIDANGGAVLAGLHDAAVVYLEVIAHDNVLQVRRRLENEPVLVVQAAAANGGSGKGSFVGSECWEGRGRRHSERAQKKPAPAALCGSW